MFHRKPFAIRVDLTDAADRRIDTYSQGMRQKVGLVQAILHEPAVLFLDEPTNGLDPRMTDPKGISDTVARAVPGRTLVSRGSKACEVFASLASKGSSELALTVDERTTVRSER